MNPHAQTLEALLFAAGRPIKVSTLPTLLGADQMSARAAIDAVVAHLNVDGSGIRLFESETEVALVTAPEASEAVRDFLRKDVMGELSKPSLETLAIVAYRGPVTKAEIEQIRGVNCSLILRNLMIRGLVEEVPVERETGYAVTMDFLQHLGVDTVNALPEYESLHGNETLQAICSKPL
ncbi:MAG: SMC-Scp complex subunit ScpB [Patescibacteria group bacterium]